MQQHIKSLLKDKLIFIAIGITISIAVLSLINIGKSSVKINHLDKIEHGFAYFILTITWLYALKTTKTNPIIVCFCCFVYGIIIEALQVTITTYRSGELLDVIANSTGILIAYILYVSFFKKNVAI